MPDGNGNGSGSTWRELFIASFFDGAPPEFLAWVTPRIVSVTRELRLAEGEKLYSVGDPSDNAYFIVTGHMRFDKPGSKPWLFEERSLVGLLDALLERPRDRDAIATKPTHVLELPNSEWFEVMEDSIEMAMRAVDAIATGVLPLRVNQPHVASPIDEGPLPDDLNLVEHLLAFRKVPSLRGARVQTLAALAGQAEILRLEPGDALSVRPERRAMYVITHGAMDVTYPGLELRESFGAGDILGGPAAFTNNATFDARATRPTLALRLSAEQWFDVMEEHFDLTRSIIKALVTERERLRDAHPEDTGREDEAAPMSIRRPST